MKLIAKKVKFSYDNRLIWEMDKENTVFCCDKLKEASIEAFTLDSFNDKQYDPVLSIKGGDDYYDGEYCVEEKIDYCPWCGDKIEVGK